MNGQTRTFLPWYRAGYATALTDPLAAGAARAAVPAAVTLRGAPGSGRVEVPMALAGPGDVLALDPAEVLRTEPFDGCADFEPAYFPYVEFVSPDLPWRFTPEGPQTGPAVGTGTQRRVRPWLALVVVPADDPATVLTAGGPVGLGTLRCNSADLPDPTEAWAWAHVQVSHDAGQALGDALAVPGQAVARLVCPRRLRPGTRYLACVVPAFAAGLAALGGDPPGAPLDPAWASAVSVELPVYLHWTFRTGTAGSFESVVRRLRPRPLPAGTGGRPLAIDAPGWGAAASSATATVPMQGALRPIGGAEPAGTDPALADSLRAVVSASGAGLQLRPPLYGRDYQRGLAAIPAGPGWLSELNTDPRRRVAAGLGAWVVAVRQEDFADAAWRQLAGTGTDLRQQTDPALADAVTGSLTDRHRTAQPVEPALIRMLRAGGPLATGAPTAPSLATPAPALVGGAPAAPRPLVPGPPVEPAADSTAGFAPHYDDAGYALLRAVAPEWLLPEFDQVPTDTVTLAQTNSAFVESFMVGLNQALAAELVWRRFPVRQGATFFDRFWGPAADLPPIGDWATTDALGSHAGPGDRLVLLVRGALPRRFPTASLYLSRAAADGTQERLGPEFSGRTGADGLFLGFPLTVAQALAGDGGAPWSVVVQEAVDHARFGADDPPAAGGTTALTTWQDLDWGNPHLAGREFVPVAGPLVGQSHPAGPGSATTVVWGLDAAQLAAATTQPAFRVRIPLALWLGPAQPPAP